MNERYEDSCLVIPFYGRGDCPTCDAAFGWLSPGSVVAHMSDPTEPFGTVEAADEQGATVVEFDGDTAWFVVADLCPVAPSVSLVKLPKVTCYISDLDGALVVEIDGSAPADLRVFMNDNEIANIHGLDQPPAAVRAASRVPKGLAHEWAIEEQAHRDWEAARVAREAARNAQ